MTTATKYKTYSKYKPSGTDWLGNIPDNWEAKRLRYFFDYHAGGVWGDEEKGDQNDLICLRVADFDFDHFGLSNNDLTTRNIPENQHSRILEKGDILLEKSGGGEKQSVGRAVSFDSNDRAVCSNFIEKLTPLKVHNSKYISYLMGALYFGTINVRSIKQTTGIQNLDIYAYFSEVVPFPEKAIQKSIADFLDHETTKIDEMVAKKQKMIDLLKEKRQALITHAVTKGLDPKAKMKPSGIDWLGDIPDNWQSKKFKYCIKFLTDFTANGSFADLAKNVTYLDTGYSRVVRLTDLRVNFTNDGIYVDENAHNYLSKSTIRGGEILLANVGAYTGLAWKVPEIDFIATLGPNMYLILFNKLMSIDFAYNLLISDYFAKQFSLYITSTAQPKLNKDNVKNVLVPIPPIREQNQIVEYINYESAKIDEMMKKVEMQIKKLQEYRQALITNAVTGKIKI